MTTSAHSVVFSDEAGPSNTYHRPGKATLGSSVAREGLIPLGAAKTVAALSLRRGVNFSPSNDTRYFVSSDSILPLKDAPPASVRCYPTSDPVSASSPAPSSSRSGTPTSVRSILKSRSAQIRLAASVEEGTLNNKEAARLLVCGNRPRLMARDSFQLLTMRSAAAESLDKGKGKALPEDLPASDDSASSDIAQEEAVKDGSSEVEEELEEAGSLGQTSLVGIILDGAEDLLTLEEAYSVLNTNLRARIPTDVSDNDIPAAIRDQILNAVTPIRDEAPAMICAMKRDLLRLLGKVPKTEVAPSEAESSPFRGLMPLSDRVTTPRGRFTPSPTPGPPSARMGGETPSKKGYNEAEVRYRREAAGVGAATLRFLALVFHVPALFGCFSDTDLASLLDLVITILRTPALPTPNPKRTYYNALTVVAGMRVPSASVLPVKDKIARTMESALADGLGLMTSSSPNGKDSNGQLKKESFSAAINLYSTYPSLFLPHYAELLPPCLRGLHSTFATIRTKSAAVVAAAASAKLNLLADFASPDWSRDKSIAHKLELFVISHFKGIVRKSGTAVYGTTGERKTEWHELERVFKETVGSATEVQWACATWAIIVSLMGSSYANSNLAPAFDHIMDRSLQPSTNTVRPLLARVAWSHAVHAYFSSGIVSSVSAGEAVISYKPFLASSSGDYKERVKTIQMPVDLALSLALDATAVSRVNKDGQWLWQRSEKTKKFQWIITCGLGAAAVVYAYTGTALYHQDQPAKEISAISGLPSSDGMPMPDEEREAAMLDRLDKVWDRVACPLAKSLGSVCGVDRLKIHGWAILDAITSKSALSTEKWSLDHLLSTKYLSGDVYNTDKVTDREEFIADLLEAVDAEAVKASEIPSWGSTWVVKRLDKLLDLFQEMLNGVVGLSDAEAIKWVKDEQGYFIIPASLLRIWSNLIRALSSVPRESPEFIRGLSLVSRHLVQILNRDPITHIPIAAIDTNGSCKFDIDTIRLSLFSQLYTAVNLLGPSVIGATRMSLNDDADDVDTAIFNTSFGSVASDGIKEATVAGCLLGQLLRAQVYTFPLAPSAQSVLSKALGTILDAGSVQGYSGKLLGDMTNAMPFIFAEQEELQLIVWRALALKWIGVIDLQPSTSSNTNHTGALLVSLLSCPFRDRQVDSRWHGESHAEDFATWESLLNVTVLRSRAKQIEPNFGVLESLAGHLVDFLGAGEKTSSTTITLSCLAAAVGYLSFGESRGRNDDHFGVNESFIPRDFLSLVNNALIESYPTAESQSSLQSQEGPSVSPAVFDLLGAVRVAVEALPETFVGKIVTSLKDALGKWMSDDMSVVKDEASAGIIDNLYITLLGALARSISTGHMPATPETMESLISLYAPRLSLARSVDVPRAFKEFYHVSFPSIRAESIPETVRLFLEEVLAAVPGMIEVPGLLVRDTFSQEESEFRFPHAQGLATPVEEAQPEIEILVDSTEAEVVLPTETISEEHAPFRTQITTGEITEAQIADVTTTGETTEEYDADVSQSQPTQSQAIGETQAQPQPLSRRARKAQQSALKAALVPVVSEGAEPSHSATSSRQLTPGSSVNGVKRLTHIGETVDQAAVSMEVDVFGTAAKAMVRGKKSKGRRGKRSAKRPLGESESMPEAKRTRLSEEPTTAEADSSHSLPAPAALVPASSGPVEEGEECINVYQSPPRSADTRRSKRRARLEGVSSEIIEFSGSPPPAERSGGEKGRTSLLNSARGWLARVPSLFSPTMPIQPPTQPAKAVVADTVDDDMDDTASVRTSTSASEHGEGEPVVLIEVPKRKRGRPRKSESLPSILHARSRSRAGEDDELLLSPETAVKRRREEEGDIAAAVERVSTPVKECSPRRTRSNRKNDDDLREEPSSGKAHLKAGQAEDVRGTSQAGQASQTSQASSGRFDDAEETQRDELDVEIEFPTNIPPTPFVRTSRQTRVLRMVEEASRAEKVIESLDFEGVLTLMRQVEVLRGAAQRNLESRAAAERAAKRAKRS